MKNMSRTRPRLLLNSLECITSYNRQLWLVNIGQCRLCPLLQIRAMQVGSDNVGVPPYMIAIVHADWDLVCLVKVNWVDLSWKAPTHVKLYMKNK